MRIHSLAALAAAVALMTGCGGSAPNLGPSPIPGPGPAPGPGPTPPRVRVLLDVTVMVPGVGGCNVASDPQEFAGQAGTTVTVESTGAAAMAPAIVVYAPDWATQLSGPITSGPGMQTLTVTPTVNGPHKVSVCATNSVGGMTRIRVTTPA